MQINYAKSRQRNSCKISSGCDLSAVAFTYWLLCLRFVHIRIPFTYRANGISKSTTQKEMRDDGAKEKFNIHVIGSHRLSVRGTDNHTNTHAHSLSHMNIEQSHTHHSLARWKMSSSSTTGGGQCVSLNLSTNWIHSRNWTTQERGLL